MSVLIIGKFQGDTAKFRQALTDRAGEFAKIADMSRSQGAIHHRFGIGDGFVVLVDEWETAGQFQQFFSNPELQAWPESPTTPCPPCRPGSARDHHHRGHRLIGPVLSTRLCRPAAARPRCRQRPRPGPGRVGTTARPAPASCR